MRRVRVRTWCPVSTRGCATDGAVHDVGVRPPVARAVPDATRFSRIARIAGASLTPRRSRVYAGVLAPQVQTRHFRQTPSSEDGTLDVEVLAPEEPCGDESRLSAWVAVLDPAAPKTFAHVGELDSFSRARVVNFLKRHSKHLSLPSSSSSSAPSSGVLDEKKELFETERLDRPDGTTRFHCRIWLPLALPTSLSPLTRPGTQEAPQSTAQPTVESRAPGLWAHGVAPDRKQAELVAAMHAEYLIDALGHHIYNLSSMQRKHAAAAHKAGRPAPMPDGEQEGISTGATVPPPLEYVEDTDATEDGEWQLVDIEQSARYATLSPPHTLLSPAVFDPVARNRIEHFMKCIGQSFAQSCVVQREAVKGGAIHGQTPRQSFFTAELRIPASALTQFAENRETERVDGDHKVTTVTAEPLLAKGKALKRDDAIVLAAMHGELLLDALSIPIFPDQPHRQKAHAQAAWSFGRRAPLPGATAKPPTRVLLPSPLKQLGHTRRTHTNDEQDDVSDTPARALRSSDEELVHRHLILTQQTTAFVETSVKEATSVAQLKRYLSARGDPRATDPFFRELIRGKVKSSVALPVPSVYGVCGGVGIAQTAAEADVLAAMHALDTLCALVAEYPSAATSLALPGTPEENETWCRRREALVGLSVPSRDGSTTRGFERPPGRRLAPVGFLHSVSVPDFDDTTTPEAATTPSGDCAADDGEASPCATSATKSRRRVAKRAKVAMPADGADTTTVDGTDAPTQRSRTTPPLTADTADGFVLVAEDAESGATYGQHHLQRLADAIDSPRVLDPLAKARVAEYLSGVGRRFEDIFTTHVVTNTDGNTAPRAKDWHDAGTIGGLYQCTGVLPVPPAFGDRVAVGVAPSRAHAEQLAAMHAELTLDTLGIPLFADPVKQAAHSLACRKAGRWAVGVSTADDVPADTPSPPPLRLSSHVDTRHQTTDPEPPVPHCDRDCVKSAAVPPLATVSTSVQTAVPSGASAPSATISWTEVTEDELDTVAKTRLQYYLSRHGHPTPSVTFSMSLARGTLLHTASWLLPLPSAHPSDTPVRAVPVSGTAPTKRDADTLAWMHAERVLHSLAIPLFDNLPRYQEWHDARLHRLTVRPQAEQNDKASAPTYPAPLRLVATVSAISLVIPVLPSLPPNTPDTSEAMALSEASAAEWTTYVQSCELYVRQKALAEANMFFDAERVPRCGQPLIDATLSQVEARPLDPHAKLLLQLYAHAARFEYPRHWYTATVGPLEHRVSYATIPVPGFPAVTAHGVGSNRDTAQKRAAMHALALLPFLDPDFDDHHTDAQDAKLHAMSAAASDGDAQAVLASSEVDLLAALHDGAQQLRMCGSKSKAAHRDEDDNVIQFGSVHASRKRRAVELYTICAGLPPPAVTHLVEVDTPVVVSGETSAPGTLPTPRYSTTVSVFRDASEESEVGGDGSDEIGRTVCCSAEASGQGPRTNERVAFARLYDRLLTESSLMEKVTKYLQRTPLLDPRVLPVLHLTPAQLETVERLASTATEAAAQRAQKAMSPTSSAATAVAGTTKPEEDEDAHVLRNALEMTQAQQDLESAALQEQYLQKIINPVYVAQYANRRDALSIARHRDEIVRLIHANPVVVICGTTGCGKTTQVPQYILDSLTERGEGGGCSIVVTQPRRISALSIAARVAAERLESVGDNCGYVIRFDAKPGRHINFCTSGVIMRLLSSSPDLKGIQYLVIDEIHERDLVSDFLLVVLRDVLTRRTDLRVILMSATLQAEQFGAYFRGAPIVNVEGYAHPVQELYLEDVAELAEKDGSATPLAREALRAHQHQKHRRELLSLDDEEGDNGNQSAWHRGAVPAPGGVTPHPHRQKYAVVEATSEIDYVIVQCAVEQGIRMVDNIQQSSVLVFLPGWEEIQKAKEIMERDTRYQIVPLHSSISPSDQMRCFLPADEGKIKVILATNIAESGITIDDVAVVVDLGRVKEKTYVRVNRTRYEDRADDEADGLAELQSGSEAVASKLLTVYASRANCVQRRGRVGRTRPGVCIRLFSRAHFASLHEFQTPEIQRTPLDALCLRVLTLQLPDPVVFLGGAMEPPKKAAIESAMGRLTALGAVSPSRSLTALGARLAQLPLEPHLGKLVLLGVAFRCLDATLTLAAAAQNDVFKPGREHRASVRLYREDFSRDTLSDDIASLNAYNFWIAVHRANTPAEVAAQLNARMLGVPQLVHVSKQKHQFFNILRRNHVLNPRTLGEEGHALGRFGRDALMFADTSSYSEQSQDVALVRTILAATFSPCIAVHTGAKGFRTQHTARVAASTDSVLAKTPPDAITDPFFVYHEAFQVTDTRRLTIHGLSSVPLWSLFLFAPNETRLVRDEETGLVTLHNWLVVHMSLRTFRSVQTLRTVLTDALNVFYDDPHDTANADLLSEMWLLIGPLVRAPLRPNQLSATTWTNTGVILPLATVPEASRRTASTQV